MCKVSHGDLMLFLNVRQKWPFVVNAEGENSMLIWCGKSCTEYSAVGGTANWLQVQAVEWGEHGEFKLQSISFWNFKGNPSVIIILGDLNIESLDRTMSGCYQGYYHRLYQLTTSFFIR